jgi:cytochrome c oxidase assembly protein subunit 15
VLGMGAFLSLLPFDGTPRSVSFYQALTRTAHQTSGALLLAAAVVFNLRCFRNVEGRAISAPKEVSETAFETARGVLGTTVPEPFLNHPAGPVSCERGAMA